MLSKGYLGVLQNDPPTAFSQADLTIENHHFPMNQATSIPTKRVTTSFQL